MEVTRRDRNTMTRAPHYCAETSCRVMLPAGTKRCPEHIKGWTKPFDKRRSDTKEHRALRAKVFARAQHSCQVKFPHICTGAAEILDRIDYRGDYDLFNTQACCRKCSNRKTALEANHAQGRATAPTAYRNQHSPFHHHQRRLTTDAYRAGLRRIYVMTQTHADHHPGWSC
jgi:5-methylcytosine-specific restriction enzyme A